MDSVKLGGLDSAQLASSINSISSSYAKCILPWHGTMHLDRSHDVGICFEMRRTNVAHVHCIAITFFSGEVTVWYTAIFLSRGGGVACQSF